MLVLTITQGISAGRVYELAGHMAIGEHDMIGRRAPNRHNLAGALINTPSRNSLRSGENEN